MLFFVKTFSSYFFVKFFRYTLRRKYFLADVNCFFSVRKIDNSSVTMVASRSHSGAAVQAYQQNLATRFDQITIESMGSSLKMCLVAEGKADIYPRLGPTSEWDTGAAHCVVEAAGGQMLRLNGQPLIYNKVDILNPWFLACGDPAIDWVGFSTGIEQP